MKKFHISIATDNIENSVEDYSKRLGKSPDSQLDNQYAFWRTEYLNFSIRCDKSVPVGTLRHLGWEDSEAKTFSTDEDVNGVLWENFSAALQLEEVAALWPEASH